MPNRKERRMKIRQKRKAYEKRQKGKNGGPGPAQTPSPYRKSLKEERGSSSQRYYDD
jgi:hypothetical protein